MFPTITSLSIMLADQGEHLRNACQLLFVFL
jgi:hypothetical protein